MPVVFDLKIDEHTELAVWKIEESHSDLMAGLQLKQHELDIIDLLRVRNVVCSG